MSKIHVYPLSEEYLHDIDRGADCICEPRIIYNGLDSVGEKAIVFVHEKLRRIDAFQRN